MKTELEQLKPDQLNQQLEDKLFTLEHLLNILKKKAEITTPGHLRISTRGNATEYYQILEPGDTHGHYIPRSKAKLAAQLAQQDYNARLIKLLEKETRALRSYLHQTENCRALQNLYTRLTIPRQKLITPVPLTDAQYIQKWHAVQWQGRPFAEDTPELFTTKGERVRSKSEVLIADALHRHGIPYRYEYPLTLKNGLTIHPDFLCLNIRTRQEFYWEHFGMMDNPSYSENTVQKLQQYNNNNFHPGKNLLLTMETTAQPLNLHYVETQIKNFLT